MGRGASCGVRTSRRTRSTGQPQGRSVPRDAKEIHGEIGDPEWVESESDPMTLVWVIDEDHWYTLTQLAEDLGGG